MNQTSPAALVQLYREAAVQYTGLKFSLAASVLVLIYDTLLTIDDEVEYIWKQKFSAVTFIFFMNRYYAIAVMVVTTLQEILPVFTAAKMIKFPLFAGSIPLTIFPNIIIGLRVYALYKRDRILGVILVAFNITLVGVGLWLYLEPSLQLILLPGSLTLNDSIPLHTCHAITSPKLSSLQAASFQFLQTAYDSLALVMIVWRTWKESMAIRSLTGLRSVIFQHGLIYYVFVFSLKLPLAVMIFVATDRLKYAMSGPALALGPMAANKLTISLRAYTYKSQISKVPSSDLSTFSHRRNSWIGTSTFGLDASFASDTVMGDNHTGVYELPQLASKRNKDEPSEPGHSMDNYDDR
ncbi:hypothetical protein SCHPADRAFT_945302 [Schizopora paradoxa]|uniref:DUF6533 domain-containing protein n=1 Tax=Schizopora paradoxa TaxID=27342 RepID=A0A0H2R6L3_9AGAM|nr:hypothetical protein SCHPADRAFT_945302 [Schizopora paradoxa]